MSLKIRLLLKLGRVLGRLVLVVLLELGAAGIDVVEAGALVETLNGGRDPF